MRPAILPMGFQRLGSYRFQKPRAVVSASAESVELTISLPLVTTAAIHLSSPCPGEDELAHAALEEMVLFYAAVWRSRFSGR